jgi:hypothetical protein
MASSWRNFKNISSRPLFTIIFRPEMLKFHQHSILTGETMVGFVSDLKCLKIQLSEAMQPKIGKYEVNEKLS